MKKKHVIDFFGGNNNAARALGLTPGAVSLWGEDVPSTRAPHVELVMQLEQQRRDKEAKKAARKAEREAKKAEEARPGSAWPASALG